MHYSNRFQPSYGYGDEGVTAYTWSTVPSGAGAATADTAAPTTKKGFRVTEAQGLQSIATAGDIVTAAIGAGRDVKIARITKKDPRAKGGGGGGGYVPSGSEVPWGMIGLAAGGLLVVGTIIYFATQK